MSTVEHTAPPKSTVADDWYRGTAVDRSEEAWREMPSDGTAAPSSSAEAAFEAGRLVLLTLVALVILAPFAPGLILVGLVAAVLAVPYLLVSRVLGRR